MTADTRWALRPAAQADLADIWRHGALTWGMDQADRYTDGLFAVFDLLAEFPEMARLRREFSPPLRLHPTRAHLVIYQQVDMGGAMGIEIIRILHAARNLTDFVSEP